MAVPRVFEVRPTHNRSGLRLRGGYDERSDRAFTIRELMNRGYEDAYRQFIEPWSAPARAGHRRTAGPRSTISTSARWA